MTDATVLPERSRRVQQHLHDAGVDTEIRVLPDSARTAAAAASAIGCDVAAIANSLVFLADGAPVLVMTSGGHRADPAVLAQGIGADEVTMAPPAVVREATGQAIGGVAPVGHPAPLRTFLDDALQAHPLVWAAAGHPHTVMPLTFDQLQHLTGGAVIAVV
ncbi:YbaK/EbsC family protein [Microbacterium sp. p3-SID336]|uniref:YbaK/EbsC family protein n=1 Tax=Microbacterium sp. p3-SID336 TaxID=2916212 RepID=UPI0021A5862E|nr:YbaK/EbsC family protein [Microbacterium sp. p3-SID336]MCT1477556.1 YbaK/EbsC family protein [Microbacterium sp. p3-SID336]